MIDSESDNSGFMVEDVYYTNINGSESVVGERVLAVVMGNGDGDPFVPHPARELGSCSCVLLGKIIKHLLFIKSIINFQYFKY